MKKRVLFWALLIFLIIPLSKAADISMSETAVQDIIVDDGESTFSVFIKNNQDFSDSFRFILPVIYEGWRIETNPAQIIIGSDKSKTIELKIIPTKKPLPNNYGFGIKLVSNLNESNFVEHTFAFKVVTYDQAIKTSLITPEDINPNKENLFRLQLENKYDVTIKDIKAVIESKYFKEEQIIVLRPYETTIKDFVMTFQPPVESGPTDVSIKIIKTINDKEVIERTEPIEIGDFTIIESISSPLSGFLLTEEKVIKTNNGNTISTETYTKKIGFFEKIFTKTNIEPTQIIKEGSSYLLTWNFELSPGDTRIIEIKTNYRLFAFSILVLIILIYFIYRLKKRDISVFKKLVYLKRSKEGISSLNIMLSIRNTSGVTVNNIKVIDTVFNTIEKPENFGSLKPKVIQQGERITRMMWEIPVIRKNEEIAISYTAKSKIPLLMDITMPGAIIKYISGRRRYIIKSNSLKLV